MTPINLQDSALRMRSLLGLLAAAMIASVAGCAVPLNQSGPHQQVRVDTVVGKVEAVYEQEYDGVYVLRNPNRPRASQTLYAHVFFTVPLEDGRTSMMVRINAKQGIQRGDLVAFQITQIVEEAAQDSPAKSQVSSVVAKHDTPYASNYGRKAIVGPSPTAVATNPATNAQNPGLLQASARGSLLH
jgi:hypothetical protein